MEWKWFAPVFAQVDPSRIRALYESDFFLPAPALQLFFASDGSTSGGISLEPDQAVASVHCCEAVGTAGLVLLGSEFDVPCDSDVQNMRAARYDVGVIAAVVHGLRLIDNG